MPKSSSIPKNIPIQVKQGDTFRRVIQFDDGETPATPVDVSSATFKLIIEGENDLTLGNGLSLFTVSAANDSVLISVIITWTGKKKYEFERTMNGIVWTPFEGVIESEKELLEDA